MEIALMIILLLLVVTLFVISYLRKRKFNANLNQLRDELKEGDKVMTDSGIVGEVVDSYVEEDYKYIILKSGKDDKVGYYTVHANAIYYVFGKDMKHLNETPAEKVVLKVAPKAEETTENKDETK